MANGTRVELTKEIMEDLGSPCKNNELFPALKMQ